MFYYLKQYLLNRKIKKAAIKFQVGYDFAAKYLSDGGKQAWLISAIDNAKSFDYYNEFDMGAERAIYDFNIKARGVTSDAS